MSNAGHFTILLFLIITICSKSFMQHGSALLSLGCPEQAQISTSLSTLNIDDAEPHVPNILLVECGKCFPISRNAIVMSVLVCVV